MSEYDLISSASYQSSASVTPYLIQQLLPDSLHLDLHIPKKTGKFYGVYKTFHRSFIVGQGWHFQLFPVSESPLPAHTS